MINEDLISVFIVKIFAFVQAFKRDLLLCITHLIEIKSKLDGYTDILIRVFTNGAFSIVHFEQIFCRNGMSFIKKA